MPIRDLAEARRGDTSIIARFRAIRACECRTVDVQDVHGDCRLGEGIMTREELGDDSWIAGPEDILRGEHGDEGLRFGADKGSVALMPGFTEGEEAGGLEERCIGGGEWERERRGLQEVRFGPFFE